MNEPLMEIGEVCMISEQVLCAYLMTQGAGKSTFF